MKVCPNDPAHTTFTTTAVEHHDWLVDGNGNFLEDSGCYESRLQDDVLVCRTCNAEAVEE